MKLLVTGGLGFIGSNFILKLLQKDDIQITNIDAELYGSNKKNLVEINDSSKYDFVKGIFLIKNLWRSKLENVMR